MICAQICIAFCGDFPPLRGIMTVHCSSRIFRSRLGELAVPGLSAKSQQQQIVVLREPLSSSLRPSGKPVMCRCLCFVICEPFFAELHGCCSADTACNLHRICLAYLDWLVGVASVTPR